MRDPYVILKSPHVTEKSMAGTSLSKYTFVVAPDANKIEIRNAVEKIFNVKVAKVNTLTVKGKSHRRGRAPLGYAADWKKAIVTLVAGQQIDVFERA
ncbi:MAG: 50S ribosomal protein L23 [Armatimonadetes bacterium]|nr:50S ribosomal protein L23 [Armatimonadota bacterium]